MNTSQILADSQSAHSFLNEQEKNVLQLSSPLIKGDIITDNENNQVSTMELPNAKKTKRRQVKNACVNCQRACKKCDDGRPCQRCINYNLTETCRDSIRKERKKGMKRGPYKLQQKTTKLKKETTSHAPTNNNEIKFAYDNAIYPGSVSKQLEQNSLLHENHNIVAPPSSIISTASTYPQLLKLDDKQFIPCTSNMTTTDDFSNEYYNSSNNGILTPSSSIGRHDTDSLATTTASTIASFQLQQPILNEPIDTYLSIYSDNQLFQALQMYTASVSSNN